MPRQRSSVEVLSVKAAVAVTWCPDIMGGTSSPRMAIRTGKMGETHRFNGFNGHFEGLIPPQKNHLNAENDDYP